MPNDISTEITNLQNDRTAIRSALAAKGVTATDHNFVDFATDIAAIPSGGLNWTQVTLTSTTGNLQGLLDQIFNGVDRTNKMMEFRWVDGGATPANTRMIMGVVVGTICAYVRYLSGACQAASSTSWTSTGASYAANDIYEYAEIGDYSDY